MVVMRAVGISLSRPWEECERCWGGHHCEYSMSPALWEPPFHNVPCVSVTLFLLAEAPAWVVSTRPPPPRPRKENTTLDDLSGGRAGGTLHGFYELCLGPFPGIPLLGQCLSAPIPSNMTSKHMNLAL